MSRRARLNQCLAVLFSLALGPAVLAQSSHLRALSDWMAHQQEAAKCFQRGDYSQAAERLNLAIKDLRPYLPDTRRIMAKTYCDLAQLLYHQQRYDEAEPLARWAESIDLRSIEILERNTPAGNPDLAATAEKYAVLLRLMKRNDDADRWHARAVEIRDTN